MNLEAPCQGSCLFGFKGLVERSFAMGIEIILDKNDRFGFRERFRNPFQRSATVNGPTVIGDPDIPLAGQRFNPTKQIRATVPLVLRIKTSSRERSFRHCWPYPSLLG